MDWAEPGWAGVGARAQVEDLDKPGDQRTDLAMVFDPQTPARGDLLSAR